jgi:pimeloyl-ACP methyl ester carboxylesterase
MDKMIKIKDTINSAILPAITKGHGGVRQIPVVFGSHGIKLQGQITLPRGATASKPIPAAVLCHGFGADRRVMQSSAGLLVKNGIATIVFDMRGHGLSEGRLDGKFHEDVIDAWHTLTSLPEIDSTRIALIGHSLGAISSILATRKIKKPRAIVALSCPAEIGGRIFGNPSHRVFSWARRLFTLIGKNVVLFSHMKVKVDWKKFLESWPAIKLTPLLQELGECAKLFVFSASDPITPFKRFAPFYHNAPGPKQTMLTKGSHVTSVEAEILCLEWIGWTVSALALQKQAA